MSINQEALEACQDLWREAVRPSFYAKIPYAEKAKIARLYVCLMTDVRADPRGRDIEMVRKRYRELKNYITEVTKK